MKTNYSKGGVVSRSSEEELRKIIANCISGEPNPIFERFNTIYKENKDLIEKVMKSVINNKTPKTIGITVDGNNKEFVESFLKRRIYRGKLNK